MKLKFLRVISALFFLAACQPEKLDISTSPVPLKNEVSNFDSKVVSIWTNVFLTIEKDLVGFRPAASSRAIAYINMAAYETVLPGMRGYISNAIRQTASISPVQKFQPKDLSWNIALNSCYSTVLRHFLLNMTPAHLDLISKTERDMNIELRSTTFSDIYDNSVEWGKMVSKTVIKYAETDTEGYIQSMNPLPPNYILPVGDGKWVPTDVGFSRAKFPFWGKVRTFSINSEDWYAMQPLPFGTSTTSEYYKQHKAISDLSENVSAEEKWQSEFWSDDIEGSTFSSPSRLFAMANQLLLLEKLNLEDAIYFYCKLGIAVNDAVVVTFKNKYKFNTERPESYITKYINPNFQSRLGFASGTPGLEPPYPGYPSLHAVLAGVTNTLFSEFFGKTYLFTDKSHLGRVDFLSAPRTFNSWENLSNEFAYSRAPLGVNIKMDCDEGLRLGILVAKEVIDYKLKE